MDEQLPAVSPQKKTRFSWLRIGKAVLAILVIAGVLTGGWFFITWRPVKIAWASVVLDRKENYLDCYSLPFYPQVQKALKNHADIEQKLISIGGVSVSPEQNTCKEWDGGIPFVKGDILVTYHSRQQREAIEKLIGDNFFGIPYRGEPVK